MENMEGTKQVAERILIKTVIIDMLFDDSGTNILFY